MKERDFINAKQNDIRLDLYKLSKVKDNNDRESIKKLNWFVTSEKMNKAERQLVLLLLGKFKTKENFEILKKIAADTKEPSPISRQNAIQSLSLYIHRYPDEVKEILEQVKDEKSAFSALATILLDKVNGNYHGKIDRAIDYNFFGVNAPTAKERFEKIISVDTKMNRQQKNKLADNVIPFTKVLNTYEAKIIEDTVTKHYKHKVGKRIFVFHRYPNCGYFEDGTTSNNSRNYIALINKSDFFNNEYNVIAHELGHTLNYKFYNNHYMKELKQLYTKAKQKKIFMDFYSATSPIEYFAQGCEAYISIYKPHNILLLDSYDYNGTNTRYKLLEQDPDLYKFIKKIFKRAKLPASS